MIPPGKVGSVRVTMDTKTNRGRLGREIELRTNDPRGEKIYLRITANVVSDVVLVPEAVEMRSSGEGASSRVLVRRMPEAGGSLRVTALDSDAEWLEAKARPVERPETFGGGWVARQGDWIIELSAASGAPPGTHRLSVSFDTGLTRESRVRLPVTVRVAVAQ